MSGRTFGVQSSWDDVFRQLGLDVDSKSLRNAISIADSMNQQTEEFLNRYVTTSTNDKGDLVFDTEGSYTFDGDVTINGNLDLTGNVTLDTGGLLRTDSSGQRAEIASGTATYASYTAAGMTMYTAAFYEDENPFVGGIDRTGDVQALLLFGGRDSRWSVGVADPTIILGGESSGTSSEIRIAATDIYFTGVVEASAQVRTIAGSAGTPSHSFTLDPDTGMYRSGTNTIGFSSNSTLVATLNTAQARFDTDVEVNDGRLWVKNDGNGDSTVIIGNDSLLLTANGMNTTVKYTPAVIFGSTDAAFTTENPKALAAIFGVASETYAANDDGGMFLEFVINGNNPGTANAVNSSSHGYLMQTSGFKPRNDGVADCGGASNQWQDIYTVNAVTVSSDLRGKTLLPDERLGLDFMLSLDGIAFLRNGGKRIHHGVAAQQVQAALGPDHAIWIEGDNGMLGVRHDELWGPQINTNREIVERLERLEAAIMAA